jgi:uncharacterized protein
MSDRIPRLTHFPYPLNLAPVKLPSLSGRKAGVHWAALLLLTAIIIPLLQAAHLPAAAMLGALAAATLVAAAEGSIRIPRSCFIVAEAVIGCMIARVLKPTMAGEILQNWPLFLAAVVAVLIVSSCLSWLLMRWQVLPGTTAIWGSFPGAAMVMTLMAEAYGEDVRLVAFMQYLRVVFVAVVASIVARIWLSSAGPAPEIIWFPSIAWQPFLGTLALIAFSVIVGPRLRIAAAPLLLPMIGGAVLQDFGFLQIELPTWLLALSYAAIGWSIGLRFTRPILVHVARAFPRVAASILSLIAICAGIGYLLVLLVGIDPLTAYLATSPGGADSVAIIAAGSNVNVPFVIAMQMARFVLVLLIGPSLARFMAKRRNKIEARN